MADFTVKLNKKSQSIKLKKIQKNIKLQHIGRRGAKGEDGDAGLSATIEIGTVTTVNPTDPATVTNVGTESEAVLDFEIPKGDKGDAGSGGGGGAVDSVNGQTGVVVLDADDIDDTSTTHKFVTSTDLTKLSNTSGTNTGDQDLSGYAQTSSLADVATSGDYDDLTNKPTIPTVPVTSVAGKTGAVTLTKGDVGLGNVDNTSDANKPISTATQSALDTKVDETITVNGQDLSSNVTLDPDDLDDTSTTNKFISSSELSKLSGIESGADVTANAEVDGGTYV